MYKEVIYINSIKKNLVYNVLYNILALVIPFITTPYISRVMGAEKIGIYSYAYSIATYFGLFILLGLNNYGNRTIAGVRDNQEVLSKTFWSIYMMQFIMSMIVLFIYSGYVVLLAQNRMMAIIQIIYLISVMMDINWFFFGIEQFRLTVTRNSIVKILNVICIFLFVKKSSDIYIYGIIMVIGPLISQIFLWGFLKRYVDFYKVHLRDVIVHIKPNLILFIPVVAVSLYTIMDKVMLGSMSTMTEVGYYENSTKLTTIPTMIVTSLGTVMLPRMSNLIANGKDEQALIYIEKSLFLSVILSTSMAFGICAISKEFVPLFFGKGFEKCRYIISISVISSIFISWANVIRTQYLIPNKKDKIYIISVFLGAFVNVIVNLLLIPNMKAIGAAIGTVCAEFSVCTYQTYAVRNELFIFKYLKQNFPFLLCGIIMLIVVYYVPFIYSNFVTIVIKVFVGIFVYGSPSLLYLKFLKVKDN